MSPWADVPYANFFAITMLLFALLLLVFVAE